MTSTIKPESPVQGGGAPLPSKPSCTGDFEFKPITCPHCGQPYRPSGINRDTLLSDLELPTRLANVFGWEDCYWEGWWNIKRPRTVGDIMDLSDYQLLKIRNVGRKSLAILRKFAPYQPISPTAGAALTRRR